MSAQVKKTQTSCQLKRQVGLQRCVVPSRLTTVRGHMGAQRLTECFCVMNSMTASPKQASPSNRRVKAKGRSFPFSPCPWKKLANSVLFHYRPWALIIESREKDQMREGGCKMWSVTWRTPVASAKKKLPLRDEVEFALNFTTYSSDKISETAGKFSSFLERWHKFRICIFKSTHLNPQRKYLILAGNLKERDLGEICMMHFLSRTAWNKDLIYRHCFSTLL